MTQAQLASRAAMNRASISDLERDVRGGHSTIQTVQRLADALGVHLIDLLPPAPKKGKR